MAVEFDPAFMPSLGGAASTEPKRSGIFVRGLSAGVDDLQGMVGASIQGTGKLFGAQGIEDYGRAMSQVNQQESALNGRPDLEVAPWHEGGADVLPWLGYQAAKQAPLIATYLAGGRAFRATGLEAPAVAEGIGMNLPKALGGAGLRPGASFAARRAAVERGARTTAAELGKDLTGGAVAGLPIAYGSMIQEADNKPGGLTHGDTVRAALLAPAYSALDAIEPAGLKGLLQRGQGGKILKRIGTAMFAGAAAEVPQEGMQTALEMTFRPDLTLHQKMHNIVDAAVTGGAVGGVFGGIGGIRKIKSMDPGSVQNEDMEGSLDEFLNQKALPAPTAYTDAGGRTQVGGERISDGTEFLDTTNGAGLRATPFDPAEQQPVEPGQGLLPGPGDISDRMAIDGSTMVAGRNREGGRFAPGQSIVEQPPVADQPSRLYTGWTTPELTTAINLLADKQQAGKLGPEVARHLAPMQEELAFRNQAATEQGVTEPAGAAARDLDQLGGGDQNLAEPAPATSPTDEFSARRAELLGNVKRLPKSIQEELANARSEDEVRAIAFRATTELDDRGELKGGKWRENLGRSAGVLDAEGKPTALHAEIGAQLEAAESAPALALDSAPQITETSVEPSGAPIGAAEPTTGPGPSLEEIGTAPTPTDVVAPAQAAPASQEGGDIAAPVQTKAEFAKEWKAAVDRNGQRTEGVKELKKGLRMPQSREDAQRMLYEALGREGEVGDGLEALAQEYGVLDDNLVLTPEAVAIAEKQAIPREDMDAAATAQGLKGSAASLFRKGVQSHVEQTAVPNFKNSDNMRAYMAGRAWAIEHNSVPRGAQVKYDPRKYSGKITNAQLDEMGQPVKATPEVKPVPRVVPEEQKRQQMWNNTVDAMSVNTTTDPSEVAALKRMIAEGASDEQISASIALVREGESLAPDDSEQEERQPFVGERIDSTSRALRGVKSKAADRIAYEEDMNSQAKGKLRKDLEHKKRKTAVSRAIDEAFKAGEITARERISLISSVVRNDLQLVEDTLAEAKNPSTLPDSVNPDLLADQASSEDQATLTKEYGEPEFNDNVRSQFSVDVQEYLGGKLQKLSANVRKIIKRTIAAVMAVAMVFNTMGLRPISTGSAAQAAVVRTQVVQTIEVPENAAEGMSDVAQAYYRIAAPVAMKTGKGFIIADKPHGAIHIFDKSGQLITTGPALYGIMPGDTVVRGVGNQTSGLKVTPAGTFEVRFEKSDYKGGKIGRLYEVGSTDKMALGGVAIHSVYMGHPTENRVGRLASETTGDNRISSGCINTTEQTFVEEIVPHTAELDGGMAIVIPENSSMDAFHPTTEQRQDAPLQQGDQQQGDQVATAPSERMTARDARRRKNDASRKRFEARQARAKPAAAAPAPTAAQSVNDNAKGIVGSLNRAAERASKSLGTATGKSYSKRMLKLLVGWMPLTHMAEQYGKIFPGLRTLMEAHDGRRATTAVIAHLYNTPKLMREKMLQSPEGKAALKVINELMELTAYRIDYAKPWDENKHLHGDDNEAMLKRRHEVGHRAYNALKGKGYNKLIDDYRRLNEMEHFASVTLALRGLIATDKSAEAAVGSMTSDPMEKFRKDSSLHNPVAARDYWHAELTDVLGDIHEYTTSVHGTGDTKGIARISPLQNYAKEIAKGLKTIADAPYFHLGRSGDQMVFGSVRLGADKKVDPAAVEHVAKALYDAGATEVRIDKDLGKPQIFLRVETTEQRDALAGVMLQLQKDGWLNPEVEVKSGPRSHGEFLPERTRQEMKRFLTAFKSDPFFDEDEGMSDKEKETLAELKRTALKVANDVWLDLLPDTATTKVLAHRESKAGYSTDMERSFAERFNIGVNSIASLSSEPEITKAFQEMRDQLEQAKVTKAGQDIDTMSTMYEEVSKREAQRPIAAQSDTYDALRAWTHAFYLGLSPSYMLVNLTQMGVLLWPELSKNHGFVETAKAMAKVTPMAFKILKATMQKGFNAGGIMRAADGVISHDALKEALGTDEATTKFMMDMIGSGIIDIGSAARELAAMAEGSDDSAQGKALRFAAAAGLYSETFTRLVAALSARELHNPAKSNKSESDYAKHVVRESMLEYSTWNEARKMGKMGVAGEFTPVMMSFMKYSVQVTWKLYRELSTAFLDHSASAEDKKASRRFLANHLVAVTALAGTLGLPFATVLAAVVEKMVDLFDDDDEPFDATAAWRNYLSDMLGKEAGEILARGAPRAGGIDLSQRVGEQSMLPFSQLLTDSRKWKEASADAAVRSLGAPISMLSSLATGFGKIGDGDILGGMSEMMPAAIKGPTKAFQMGTDGYKDMQGNQLPMSPGATAILSQIMGFTPAEKAEYSEARGDIARRKGILTDHAKVLRDDIVDALMDGDMDTARSAIKEARKFDHDNPKFAVMPDIEASIKRRRKLQMVAERTNTPIGVDPKDKDARRLTGYANVEYRAQ